MYKKNNFVEKHSYGIVCIRFNPTKNLKEILLIKKRISYNFSDFVLGKYDPKNTKKIKYMFNNMTSNEKVDIITNSFDYIWKKVMYCVPKPTDYNFNIYKDAYEKFTELTKDITNLIGLLDNTRNVECLYEFPKGRKTNSYEFELNTALREFEEETNIPLQNLDVYPDVKKRHTLELSYIKYITDLYLGIYRGASNNCNLRLNNLTQIMEISEVKWLSLEKVKEIDELNRLWPVVKYFMTIVKKHFNNGRIKNNKL